MTAMPSGTTSLPMPSPAMTATRYLFAIRILLAARASLARAAAKCARPAAARPRIFAAAVNLGSGAPL